MEHNDINNSLSGAKKAPLSILKISNIFIKKAIVLVSSTFSLPIFFIIALLVVIATSLTLLFAVFFGEDVNETYINDSNAFQTEVVNVCQADVNRTINWMRDLYMDKSEDATLAAREYVIDKLGPAGEAIPDPNEGFLAGLKDLFGINKGGTDLTLKDWTLNDYENSNKITMHFNKSYEEVGQTLYGYITATIGALDNYRQAYESQQALDENGQLPEDDLELDCGDECTVMDYLNALKTEKEKTISDILSEQKNADNRDKVFYIDETYTNWTDTLQIGDWEVREQKNGECQVSGETGHCPGFADLIDYTEVSREEIQSGQQINPDTNHAAKNYKVSYTYTEITPKNGPMGDITVPIYLNVDEFLKNEKEEILDLMTKDLKMTRIDAENELNEYINGSFEANLMTCGFTPDPSIFGSNVLIGVGNQGYIGSVDIEGLSELAGKDTFDPYVNALVWGEAFKFIEEGKINAPLSHQCTTFVHWMFYKYYGYDCANGNGKDMATNLANKMPDKFQSSTTPAPGAVASVGLNSTYGHVLFINAVFDDDGDGNWDRLIASDGNISGVADSPDGIDGVRIMREYTKEQFLGKWSPAIFAVPIQ